MVAMFGSNVTVISQSESIATCMDSDPHPKHDWWYTSEGGGHMLNEVYVTEDIAAGIDVRRWRCPGVPTGTYHGITRYQHVACGYVTTDVTTLELLNDLDPACPRCWKGGKFSDPNAEAYGEALWSHADGSTVSLTCIDKGNGPVLQDHLTRLVSVDHVRIHKSWVNGPEWWLDLGMENPLDHGGAEYVIGFPDHESAVKAIPWFVDYCVSRGLFFDWRTERRAA